MAKPPASEKKEKEWERGGNMTPEKRADHPEFRAKMEVDEEADDTLIAGAVQIWKNVPGPHNQLFGGAQHIF